MRGIFTFALVLGFTTAGVFAALASREDLRQLLFAKMYGTLSKGMHERMSHYEEDLLKDLSGNIIEIGSGLGAGLRHFGGVESVTFVEPNPHFQEPLQAAIKAANIKNGTLIHGTLATLAADPNRHGQADAVVSILVLCSVPDVKQALDDIYTLLKPGGKLYMLEHVGGPPGTYLRYFQQSLDPAWGLIGDGCHLVRNPYETAMENGRWESLKKTDFLSETRLPVVNDMIAAVLKKR
eukprot:comp12756_c0_seq1/m.7876 comp12756_c0_seq1/g.7876  ORF comp12756_c0_seq1/g.7876 comp12756_c0_seq1/m.7876 type:complete len:237 (-) comp12756_c0_seq1:608-1318(-)